MNDLEKVDYKGPRMVKIWENQFEADYERRTVIMLSV